MLLLATIHIRLHGQRHRLDHAGIDRRDGRGDRGRFRTPSLREVSRTAPYMHDGRFATLADAITGHFDVGLEKAQVADLVAFMESLSSAPRAHPRPKLPDYQLRTLGKN